MVFIIEELVKIAKNGNEEAMEDIITKFKYFIIKHATRYMIPSYDLQDLIEYGNLSVLKAVDQYNLGNKKFTTYCTNTVINNYNALLKKEIKLKKEVQNEDVLSLLVNDYSLEDEFIRREDKKRVVQALNVLGVDEKRIIKGVYFHDKTLKDTALECNIDYRKAVEIKKKH